MATNVAATRYVRSRCLMNIKKKRINKNRVCPLSRRDMEGYPVYIAIKGSKTVRITRKVNPCFHNTQNANP